MLNFLWQNEYSEEDINKTQPRDLYATDDDDFDGVNDARSSCLDQSSDE